MGGDFVSGRDRVLSVNVGRRLTDLFTHTLRMTRTSGATTRRCLSNVILRVVKTMLTVSRGGHCRISGTTRGVRDTGVVVRRGICGSVSPRRLTVGLKVDCS